MALPAIASYPLPAAEEIPVCPAPWKLAADRAALLIHDMQKYFVNPYPRDEPPMPQVIANIAALKERCHELGIPIFFTAQKGNQFPPDRGLQADFWGPGMAGDPAHTAIVEALAPSSADIVLEKFRYSAFQRSNLERLMRARKRDQLIITGVYAHIGCLATAAEAFNRDIQPFLAADAMASFSREKHDMALACATASFAAALTTDAILRDLSEGAREEMAEGRTEAITLESMRAEIAAMLHEPPDAVGDDDNLIDLGLDSIRAMALVQRWIQAGAKVEFSEFAETPELRAWWKLVSSRMV